MRNTCGRQEDLAHDAAVLDGARQVVPDRLLEHDPRVLLEVGVADAAHDRREGRGGVPQ